MSALLPSRTCESAKRTRPHSEARAFARRSCDALCRIGTPRTTLVARVLDWTAAGVRCEIVNGLVPRIGDAVVLEWPDATTSPATVSWIGRADIGLKFRALVPNCLDRIDTASLGSESYSRLRALHAAWLAQHWRVRAEGP